MNRAGLELDLKLMLDMASDMSLKPQTRSWAWLWADKIRAALGATG